MFLFSMEADGDRRARLADICERILHRLGDSAQTIWTYDEIQSYVERGGREMADAVRAVWDQVFLECLPLGFSVTVAWEESYVTFTYGTSPATAEFELDYMVGFYELDDVQWANHTSPSELHYLEGVGASIAQVGTARLPSTLTDIERVAFDHGTIQASNHRRLERHDARYQLEPGDVIAYTHEREGYDILRKVRIPVAMATIEEVDGSWGAVRDTTDLEPDSTGTWGVARQVPDHHPMGYTEGWGLPRRFYSEDDNFKVEFWRQPRVDVDDSELPARYFQYLADYAQWRALIRNGAGQNYKLAELYKQKWERGLIRMKRRVDRKNKERLFRLGGNNRSTLGGPPTPRLPWQYGNRVR